MKRFFSILGLMLMVVFITPDADAKKFGGGKSMGKSYKTAPAPQAEPTNTNSIGKQNDRNNQTAPASANSSKKGLIGGMLGGLLAGGLLAALFAGGAFEGIQFGDFILIAILLLIVFIVIRSIKGKRRRFDQPPHAYAEAGSYRNMQTNKEYYHQQPQAHQPSSQGFSNSNTFTNDVPFNYPPNFDMSAFLRDACEHYRILQVAWNKNQLATIQEYVSIELYNELAKDRAELVGEQHTEVMYVDAKIVRADHNSERAQLSLQFSGRYRDEKEGIEEDIKDLWHLERSLTQQNAPWLIVGIQG